MRSRDLLSIVDITAEEVRYLIDRAYELKREVVSPILTGKSIALIFEKPSLRTRVSFDVAINELGGNAVYLGGQEVGIGSREPVRDIAKVLSGYVSAIIARTFSHDTLDELAAAASIPVINALSDYEHPCQALADLLTIYEKKGRLDGVKIAFIGDGNNVANSLAFAALSVGASFTISSPLGYGLSPKVLEQCNRLSSLGGGSFNLATNPNQAVNGADVVYTDVWTSMGQEKEASVRRKEFAAYQVNEDMLSRASETAIFMHPLPAHPGEEVSAGLLDDPRSVVFDQAENRLHAQKAILVEILS